MALDEPQENDTTVEAEGIQWYVSPKDRPFILDGGGVRVDHTTSWFGEGFLVTARGRGGCC